MIIQLPYNKNALDNGTSRLGHIWKLFPFSIRYWSLHEVNDAIESHFRSPASLAKTEASYGSLLISVMFGKLPVKDKQTFQELKERENGQLSICNLLFLILEIEFLVETKSMPSQNSCSKSQKPKHICQCRYFTGWEITTIICHQATSQYPRSKAIFKGAHNYFSIW